MARLPVLHRDDLSAEDQGVWDRVAGSRGSVRGPFALLIHNPPIADRVAELGAQLRVRSVLSGAERALAILAAGREVEAGYEWLAHEPLGLQEGTRPEAIEVLRHTARPMAWSRARRSSSTSSAPCTASIASQTTCTLGPRPSLAARPWSRWSSSPATTG